MIISGPDKVFTLNEPMEKTIKKFIQNIQRDIDKFSGLSVKRASINSKRIKFKVCIDSHLYSTYRRLENEDKFIFVMRIKHACIKAGWKNVDFAENTATESGGLNLILIAP